MIRRLRAKWDARWEQHWIATHPTREIEPGVLSGAVFPDPSTVPDGTVFWHAEIPSRPVGWRKP